MKASRVEPWDTMLRQAKELGARVYACSMMAGVMGLAKDDFNDLVDDVVGAATFCRRLSRAKRCSSEVPA